MQTWYVFGTTNRVSREVPKFPNIVWSAYQKAWRCWLDQICHDHWVLFFHPAVFFLFLYWGERIPAIDWQPTWLSYYADPCTSWVLTTVVSTSTKYKLCFASSVPVSFIIRAPKIILHSIYHYFWSRWDIVQWKINPFSIQTESAPLPFYFWCTIMFRNLVTRIFTSAGGS